jgi:cytoskeletal protein CcmA (bactofilin family)
MSLNNLITVKVLPSLVSKNVFIEGDVHNGGALELEGKIKGNIEADVLTIRESGEIIGEAKCKVFNIKGAFNGNVSAEKINISDTAKVLGTLEYKFLSVDYGAHINCQLKRVEDSKSSVGNILKSIPMVVEQQKPDKKNDNERVGNK